MIEVNKWNKGGMLLMYDITLACNNRCPYCFMLDRLDNTLAFNHEVFDEFKKAFNALDRTNEIRLALSGGEPLFVDEIERIKELDWTNTELSILSNLNYPESVFKERLKLIEGLDYHIECSIHESSNVVDVKRNILHLHNNFGNVDVTFMATPDNILTVNGYVEFATQHNIPYTIHPLRLSDASGKVFCYSDYGENAELLERLISKPSDDEDVTFDDRLLTGNEIHEFRIQNISHIYYTQCELSIPKISFDGVVTVRCEYPYRSHISKGIMPPEMVLCSNNCCNCTLATYKKLLRPKDRDANKEFHEYFGD
jgi:sulfatase maturation enzyme AslB (radical SAM superfamily)